MKLPYSRTAGTIGIVAVVYQWLFLACFPIAILLAIMGEWVAAAAVFLIGTPVFGRCDEAT